MSINPLQQPVNFGQPIDLTQAFAGLSQAFQQYGEREELQRMQQARQQAMQSLYSNPNAGYKEYAQVAMMMPKDQAESILKTAEMLDKVQLQKELSYNMQVMSALKANPQIGIDLLNQRAEAAKNSGKMDQFQVYNGMAQAAQKDPLAVANHVGLLTAAIPGSKDALEGAAKLGTEARAQELQPALVAEGIAKAKKEGALATQEAEKASVAGELAKLGLDEKRWGIKNLQSEISTRSARLNLDAQTTAATVAEKLSSIKEKITNLPEFAQKEVNTSAVAAATAKQSAQQFNSLAQKLDEQGGGWGALSSASEWMKKSAGFQNGLTDLRNEYTRLKNNAAIKMLPPGPATDKDIQMAMSGFPPENADAKTMARFLRGMAKMNDIDASLNNAKTDWLTSNKGQLGRASSSFIAGDFAVKPGETYADFSARVTESVAKKYSGQPSSPVDKIPTNKNPSPQNIQNDIRRAADAILSGGR